MSNGLQHAAPPSFFPTAKELSSGLQWFKEHPILAAAAATAVSVITYLHTADDDEILLDGDLVMEDEAAHVGGAMEGTPTAESIPPLPRSSSAPPDTTRTSPPPPPALRKPGSEGKMSPAAVTWVDEHGGSLTQVFEHLLVADDDDDDEDHDAFDDHANPYPDLNGPMRGAVNSVKGPVHRPHGRPPTPRRAVKSTDDGDASPVSEDASRVLSPHSGHWMGPFGVHSLQSATGIATPPTAGDRQTESPQWGWYVPITPPQDHLTGTVSSLPRAVACAPSSAVRSAAATAIAAVLHNESFDTSSSMRRSASGRIKAA